MFWSVRAKAKYKNNGTHNVSFTQTSLRELWYTNLFVFEDNLIDDSVDKGDQVVKETLMKAFFSIPKQFVSKVQILCHAFCLNNNKEKEEKMSN